MLTEAGLAPALETLADTAPIPIQLDELPRKRYPDTVETTAYLTVAEAIEDAATRNATHATANLVQLNDQLVVTINDDGTDAQLEARLPRRPCRRARRLSRNRTHHATSGDPVRVVVAEDTMLTREGIVHLLKDAGIDVVAEAEDADGLLHHVRLAQPDVAITDIRMPPTHTDEGLVVAQQIRREHPNVGVLVLSQYVEPSYATRLLEDHPERVGYLLKERVFDIAILIDALRRINDGETVIDPTIVSRLLGRPPTARSARRLDRPRARSAWTRRRRPLEPRHRQPPLHHRTNSRSPRQADLPKAPARHEPRVAPPRTSRARLPTAKRGRQHSTAQPSLKAVGHGIPLWGVAVTP